MATINLASGETIDAVPMLVAVHGYVVSSIELTGKDVTAMRRLFERDTDGFRAFIVQFEARFPENRVPHQVPAITAPSTHKAPVGWATVRVEDTCDGLLINADDMKRFGLQYDAHYEGQFLPDGRYRIAIPSQSPAKRAESPQCCMCGKKDLSTVEGDGGSECELEDGRWVCSAVCWDRAVALSRLIPNDLLNYEAPDITEDDGYLMEAALQAGSVMLNDDGTVHAFKQEDLLRLIKCAMDRDFTPLWEKPTEGGE